MTKWIIVKYADQFFPDGKAPLDQSIFGTHTAIQQDINKPFFEDRAEAEEALKLAQEFNPGVGYGIVEGLEEIDYSVAGEN